MSIPTQTSTTSPKTESSLKEHTFFGHLDELKNCVLKSFLAVIVASCLAYIRIDHIMALLTQPVGQLVFTAPTEAFMAEIYLTLFCGFFLALPVVIYQIWRFVYSGLKLHERKLILIYGPLSLVFFVIGSVFAYFIMIPISMKFLLSFSSQYVVPMITVNKYISFLGSMILIFGIIFELPLILLFLTKIGVATPEFLIQKRRHAIVLILVASAFLTPPDIITLLLLSGPLILLYEAGIIASRLTYRANN